MTYLLLLLLKILIHDRKLCFSRFTQLLGNTLLNWFNDNSLKVNPSKYHLAFSGNDSSKITVGNETSSSSKCEKLLGFKIDSHLNFKEHIESLCKKASQKINALPRLASSMSFEQRRLIMNSFVIFHFFILSSFMDVSQPKTKCTY